jgi:Excalibur calcium-binding domain
VPPSSRTAVTTAALSAALVVGMAGTAIATEDPDCHPTGSIACSPPLVTTTPPRARPEAEPTAAKTAPAVPVLAAAAVTVEAPPVDRDCPDFATQADAQVALHSTRRDPEGLDADNDGIACEDHFGTEGRQVAVVPRGGVATGQTPSS